MEVTATKWRTSILGVQSREVYGFYDEWRLKSDLQIRRFAGCSPLYIIKSVSCPALFMKMSQR
jgi:hypothetical protein